jgi:hypothetical protein
VGTEDVEGCQGVDISEGMVECLTCQFKYLGIMLVNDGKLEVELAARETTAVFRFEKMWGIRHHFVCGHKDEVL